MASHDELKNPNPRGRILEYAEFIEDQVARARSRIKSNDMFRAILWMITVSLGVIFLEVILDHTVELPSMARRLILFGGLGTAAVYAFVRIARPMLLKVNTLYAAKSIESTDSTFKNSLINYLQIRDDAGKVAPSVLAQIEARAVADLSKVNVDDVVDQSQIVRLSYALAAIVVGICLYSWITPKSLLDSARRAFLADVQRPTNTRFLNITPGDKPDAPKVMTGMPVEFSVETLGAQPEAVTLFTSRDEGKTFAETPMTVGNSFADPWKAKIDRVPGKLFYYMAGGDGKTRTYELEVLPVAIVEKVSLDYDFPEYAQAPRREGVEEGNVEALQGTRITITAFTNQPARSGTLDFGPRPPVPLIPVQGDQKKLTGTFLVDTDGQYSVKFNTVDGQANPEPVLYDIRVVKDVAPTARFIRPESPTLRPANARVPLVIEASDDFGLKEVKLHVHKNGEILQKAVDLIEPNAKEVSKQIQKTVALDLEPLSLKVGDKIEYWLTLRDNCDLQPNKFETPKQTIEIQEPVSQPKREELAQNEMAQAREDTGDQNPMDNPPDQGDKSEQNANEKSGNQQSDPQQQQGKQKQDQQKQSEEQKKDGQGKGSQGDQSEAADPSDNAKEGGKQSQGKQPKSSPSSKSDSKTKNSQKNQSGQAGDQNDQDTSEKQDDSQKQNGAGKSSASKSGKQKNQGSQKSDPMKNEGDGSENAQEKQEPGDQGKQSAKQKSQADQKKPGDEKSEPDPNGQGKSSGEKQDKPGAEKAGAEKKQGGDKSDPSGAEKKQGGDKSDPTGAEKKQGGDSGEDGLPKGEPKAEDGSGEKGDKKSSKDLSKQDRDKLNKLRDALGLNDKPQDAGEKGEGEEKAGSEKDGQEKMSDAGDQSKESAKSGQEKGQPGKQKSKSGQEKGKPGDSGKESAESGQEKGQEKGKPGDSGKESAESGDKAGDEKGSDKGEPGAEPKDSAKAGDEKGQAGQEKGQPKDSSKSAGEKGERPDGESKKAGKDGVEKGSPKNQSKQAGNEKAKAGDEAGKEKGQGQPKTAQEKSDKPGEQGKDAQQKGDKPGEQGKDAQQKGDKPGEQGKDAQKGDKPGEQGKDAQKGDKPGEQGKDAQKGDKPGDESGKSEKPGEENGKPGPLTDAPPKAGGMRKGTETPAPKPDESTPSPRAVEPDQPEPNENLTPDQKADQRLLKRLREMVDKNEISKDLEDSTGLSREEIDQFVRKFEAPPKEERKAADGDGTTEVTSTPGKDSENRKVSLPGNLPGGQVTSRSNRGAGMVADDGSQGNLEGARARIPSALRSRFEAYQKGLSRANPRGAGTTNSGESRPANKNGDEPGSGSDR